MMGIFLVAENGIRAHHTLNPSSNAYKQLQNWGIALQDKPLRLHLGCGEMHLDGYVNIDYPLTEHTIQSKSGADVFGDITKISVPQSVVDEIRLHHVFEHFDRARALALLCAWHIWLKPGGILHIEVPDFLTSARMVLEGNYTYAQKQIILRHIFGSHEAAWAIHCDGWYKEKFEHVLSLFGFTDITIQYSSWSVIRNISVYAKKQENIEYAYLQRVGQQILSESMVNVSAAEQKMLNVWIKNFSEVFAGLIAHE